MWVVDLINSHMANCFWDDYEGHKKLHLANWHLIYMKKEFGGLGLKDLNLCLLGSWVKWFIKDEGRLWRSVVEAKYYRSGNIFHDASGQCSPFWKGVMLAAQVIKFGYRWLPGDGKRIRFWEDTWFGTASLAVQFWNLYCICNEKTKTLAEVRVNRELRLSIRRTFSIEMMQV
jgi:hypothetical protein